MTRWLRAVVPFVMIFSAACWEDPASTVGRAHLVVAFNPLEGASYTARLNGQTFSSPGQFSVQLESIDPAYEVSGSFNGAGIRIEFHTTTTAGVQAGSVTSLAGPVSQTFPCAITYVSTPAGAQQFRVQFRLTGNIDQSCR